MSTTVNLLDLSASALASSVWAASSIRDMYDRRNTRLKEDGTFVTDADLCAQHIIEQALESVSSDIRIVGEEEQTPNITPQEPQEQKPSLDDPDYQRIYKLAQEEIRQRVLHKPDEEDSSLPPPLSSEQGNEERKTVETDIPSEYLVDPSRVSVFIDPLDGTKSYAHGDFDSVSILIAIILDNNPCFGVICKPWGYHGNPTILQTTCTAVYGGDLIHGVFLAGGHQVENVVARLEKPPRAVISSTRSEGVVEDFISHMATHGFVDDSPLHISGAGEKSLRLILGTSSEALWFFPKPGTSLWDVAASDAILRFLGGKVTDKFGNSMDYSKSWETASNDQGVIASNSAQLHAECIRLFHEGDWVTRK